MKFAVIALTLGMSGAAFAGSDSASAKVKEGVERYRTGDYAAADKAFSAAEAADPENAQITFDRGCALLGKGDFDAAITAFEKSALAKDKSIAVQSLYNLGASFDGKAKKLFGDKPEETDVSVRTEASDLLAQAASRYRQCLKLDPEQESARHNLELIQAWTTRMKDVWELRDRMKAIEKLDAMQHLDRLEKEERELRQSGKTLAKDADSPLRRESIRKTARTQKFLAEELEPFKAKVRQAIAPPQNAQQLNQPPTQPAMPPEKVAEAQKVLDDIADLSAAAMREASEQLRGLSFASAAAEQTTALDHLNQTYMALVPFEGLLKRSLSVEKSLVEGSERALKTPNGPEASDPETASEDQVRVAKWGQVLGLKAQAMLRQMPETPKADPNATKEPAPKKDKIDTVVDPAKPAPAADPKLAQAEQMKKALAKAVESAPKIEQLSGQASDLLRDSKTSDALPRQKEVYRLLKEIEDLLPKQDNQSQQQNDQQQNQDQQKQDQKDQQQQNKDQQKQDQKNQQGSQDKKQQGKDRQNKDQQQDAKENESKDEKKSEDSKRDEKSKEEEQKKAEKEQQEKDAREKEAREKAAKEKQAKTEKDKQKKDADSSSAGKESKDAKEKASAVEEGEAVTLSKDQIEAMLRRARDRQQKYREIQKAMERAVSRPENVKKDW